MLLHGPEMTEAASATNVLLNPAYGQAKFDFSIGSTSTPRHIRRIDPGTPIIPEKNYHWH
jgi:hypothetical protein